MSINSFSCVIVTYNRVETLTYLLNDINCQTVLPYEVIIVNNGSYLAIDSEDYRFNISLITNRINSLTIGRNIGLNYVKTPFVFFLDDDIRFSSLKYFEGMISDFISLKNCFGLQAYIKQDKPSLFRSLFFRFFFLYTLDDSCMVKPSVNVTYPKKVQQGKIISCEWLSGTNQLYRTEELKSFFWDEKLFKYCDGEDLDFTYNLFRNKKMLYLTFSYQILHTESTTSRLDSKELVYMREVYGYYLFSKYFKTSKQKFIYFWSRIGKILICIFNILRFRNYNSMNEFVYLVYSLTFVLLEKNELKKGNLSKFNKKFGYDL